MNPRLAADHALHPGRPVYRLAYTRPDGTPFEALYLYSTARSFDADEPRRLGLDVTLDSVPWDGVKEVSFDNGD